MLKLAKKKNVPLWESTSVSDLHEAIELKQLQMEAKLLESQWDWLDKLVDPRSAYVDDATGEPWMPVNNGRVSFALENVEPFTTEQEHTLIRRRMRRIFARNPYAQNLIGSIVSFVVGKGHVYDVCARDGVDAEAAKPYEVQLQKFVDTLLKVNRWKKRQKEIKKRQERDGEAIIRIFPQSDGYALFRFVEPAQLKTPAGWQNDPSASFGIKTDPDDVETVEMYFIDDEEVEPYEIQHRKSNVDMNCKRGLSTIYCTQENFERATQLLTNMSTLLRIRAAIGMIRKHDKTSGAVRSFATNTANNPIQYRNPITNQTVKGKTLSPGSVIDATKDTDYEFPSLNANASDGTEILAAELRAVASSKGLAEYMVGSDASNANYSSTMVAESPAVRFFESEQEDMMEADLELIWAAVDYAIDAGKLPKECRELCDITAEPPQLVTRDPLAMAQADQIYNTIRVKSPQTIATGLGLDAEQEQTNFTSHDDANLEGGPLPMPVDGQPPKTSTYVPPAEDVIAQEDPEAALLNMAGGITGYIEIMAAKAAGSLSVRQASVALQKFFRMSPEEADELVMSA